jgi:hypothetical protein
MVGEESPGQHEVCVMRRPALATLIVLGASAAPAFSANYSESTDGDLSNDRLSPTFLQLDYLATGNVPGSNVLDGATGRNATTSVIDRDYLWINVPTGYILGELRVGTQTQVGGGGSFIGVASGTFMPVDASVSTAAGLLGWRVYGTSDRGTNTLDDMAVAGNGASGFPGTLGAGDYTFWIQELAPGSYPYRFNFVLTPVPVPAALWLFASGIGLLTVVRRRGPAA